ncbi:hypothetical protein TNCV_1516071 [Trichonephila clavipes]|nr:hypothetical protein TNCV_1516071 [Trichonephila clavipes]
MRMTPKLPPPFLTTTLNQCEDISTDLKHIGHLSIACLQWYQDSNSRQSGHDFMTITNWRPSSSVRKEIDK